MTGHRARWALGGVIAVLMAACNGTDAAPPTATVTSLSTTSQTANVCGWSPFAYVDAEQIRVRRTTAVAAPEISGFIVAEAFWNHFEVEWEAAETPGVGFWATVVYLPEVEVDALSARPNVADVVTVPSYRSGPNPDPTYPGELYLDDHEIPGDVFDVPPPRECVPLGS